MTVRTAPSELTASVRAAVAEGAWSPGDVIATVTAEVRADRGDVLATLGALVAAGELEFAATPYPSFRVRQRRAATDSFPSAPAVSVATYMRRGGQVPQIPGVLDPTSAPDQAW